MQEDAFLRLIDLTYESSLNPSHWSAFLKALTEAAGATHVAIKIFDFQDLSNNLPAHFGFSPDALTGFDEYWGSHSLIPPPSTSHTSRSRQAVSSEKADSGRPESASPGSGLSHLAIPSIKQDIDG
jgi:hypothetical protein